MFPYWNYAPTFEYPLSGDVVQDIETSWFSRMKGVPELEMAVITEAASYGTQLDTLIEAVQEIAAERGSKGEKVQALNEMALRVAAAKDASIERLQARIEELEKKVADLKAKRGASEG